MKPFSIVLTINLAFLAIWGLFFGYLVNRPEMIPLFLSLQTAINLLGAGVFFLDRKPPITKSFLICGAGVLGLTLLSYYLLSIFRDQIGLEESYTAFLPELLPII